MKTENRLLTKENSAMLHGAAILMMIYHHLFVVGNEWCINHGVSFFDLFNTINIGKAETAQMSFARFCKICVAVFAFTSGYAMFIQLDRKNDGKISFRDMYRYCLKRLGSFFRKYFLVFVFVTVVEMCLNNPYGFDFSPRNLLLNALGFKADYNATWWYIAVYYCMVLSSPVIYWVLNRFEWKKLLLIILGFGILAGGGFLGFTFLSGDPERWLRIASNLAQSALSVYMIIFAEGMICAKYGILDFLAGKLNIFTSVVLLLLTMIVRVLIIRIPGDSVFDVLLIIPFVLSFTTLASRSGILSKVLRFFGRYSSYMWYWHPYFYAYLFFFLVQKSDISLLVYVQVVAYTLLASVAFTYLEKGLDILFGKVFHRQ